MRLPGRIALVGFMGAGKTTVGRLLAGRTGYRFVDSDDEIESRTGLLVEEIFRVQGEASFRALETRAICDLLLEDRIVLATGGGAFVQPHCAKAMLAKAFIVYLECDFREAVRRLKGGLGRPLMEQGEAAAEALLSARQEKYARAHSVVDTTGRTPDEVAGEILQLVRAS